MSKVIYKQRCNPPSKPNTPTRNRAHLQYIAQRPGAVLGKNHGLFGQYGGMKQCGSIDDLNDALLYVRRKSQEKTNVFRAVLSMKEEDALHNNLYSDKAHEADKAEMLAALMTATLRACDSLPAPRRRYHYKGHPKGFWFEAKSFGYTTL